MFSMGATIFKKIFKLLSILQILKRSTVIMLILLLPLQLFSQSKFVNRKSIPNAKLTKEQYTFKLLNETFQYCDTDFDGFVTINLKEIKEYILGQNLDQFRVEGGIFISTSNGNVYYVTNVESSPTRTLVCSNNFGSGMLDIAISQNGEMYVAVSNKIYKINEATCQIEVTYDFGFRNWVTSLSFDRNNNLYLGGFDSKVYRLENGNFGQLVTWHDFGVGQAAGDFVMFQDKMYIAWDLGGSTRLYEVTVDVNTNYISHVDLGGLPNNTYGLASELGFLYGVTSSQLYKINLSPLSFNLVLANTGFDDWYGAAGKNEAVEIQTNVFETMIDAQNNQNALPDTWINTVSGGQTVYVALTNTVNNQQVIVPVDLVIGIPPTFTDPSPVVNCVSNSSGTTFNLRALEPEIVGNQNSVEVNFFESEQDAVTDTNPLPDNILITSIDKPIYVRMENTQTSCLAVYSFTITTRSTPMYDPLNNIYYCTAVNYPIRIAVDLQEKKAEIMGNQSLTDFETSFYQSSQDADLAVNEITQAFLLETTQKDIFVRMEDSNTGCYEIKTFTIYTVPEVETDTFDFTVETTDWTYNDNSIHILVSGIGDFEYSIDGTNYQTEPVFEHLATGSYEVHVRDKTDCSAVIKEVLLLMYPNFFTPNADGFNDYWNIKYTAQEPNMKIYIFDRYGKLLRSLSPLEVGWDGNYHGRPMPSTDYWFLVIREDKREHRGHFTLKR
jgi:gliding motility-associated-like protein